MLTALRIGNFKAFAEPQTIPIKPLTLIFGANSAGKSSIIHALVFARHALDTGELDIHRTAVGGEAIDLGGFRQYIHRRDAARRMEWSAEIDVARLGGRLAQILAPVRRVSVAVAVGVELDDKGDPAPGSAPAVHAYDIIADGESILRMSRRRDGNLQLDRLGHEHPVLRQVVRAIVETATTAEAVRPADFEGLHEAITRLIPEVVASGEHFLPKGVSRLLLREPPARGHAAAQAGQPSLFAASEASETAPADPPTLFPISRGQRAEDLAGALRFFLPRTLDELIGGLTTAIVRDLARVRYLGPLRSYPPRHLAFSQQHDPNWFAGGGHAWDIVRRNEQVRGAVNAWLGDRGKLSTPYELKVDYLLTLDDLAPVHDALVAMGLEKEVRVADGEEHDPNWMYVEWLEGLLEKLRQFEQPLSRIQDLQLIDKRTETPVSHRDVGIGVSQVLPVLVAAFAGQREMWAIEQPEIHLHPALQAELADIFIDSALGERKNTFLLETHSEHLILRVMRRMRDTVRGQRKDAPPVSPEDVAVLFVEPTTKGSVVHELRLKPDGSLLDPWPGGFFEESFSEIFG
jgi:predicted ATPase